MGYATPTLVGGKRRPPALLIDSLTTAHYDDEAPTRHYSFGCGEEIPVRRTFIDFGKLTGTPPASSQPTINTAPARMTGASIRESFDAMSSLQIVTPSGASCTAVAGAAPSSTASSTRLTVTTDCADSSVLPDLEQVKDDEIRGKAKRALLTAASSGILEAALQRTQKTAGELPDVPYRLSPASMKAAGYSSPQSPRSPESPTKSPTTYSATPTTPRSPAEPADPGCLLQADLWKGLDAAAWAKLYAGFEPRRTAPAPEPSTSDTAFDTAAGQSSSAPVCYWQPRQAPVSPRWWVAPKPLGRWSDVPITPVGQLQEGAAPAAACMPATQVNRPQKETVEQREADDDDSSEDDDSSDEDLGLCPVYSADLPLPSAGSALHSEGTCKRCCFFPKGRCNNGYDCHFCHFAHDKRKQKNKKKKKKKRKSRPAVGGQQIVQSAVSAPTFAASPQAKSPHSPSVQEVFGDDSPYWTRPHTNRQAGWKPSQLVCHGLSFVPVPPTVAFLPGAAMARHNTMSAPMMQQGLPPYPSTNVNYEFVWAAQF